MCLHRTCCIIWLANGEPDAMYSILDKKKTSTSDQKQRTEGKTIKTFADIFCCVYKICIFFHTTYRLLSPNNFGVSLFFLLATTTFFGSFETCFARTPKFTHRFFNFLIFPSNFFLARTSKIMILSFFAFFFSCFHFITFFLS
jgi:hypothetical protein